MIILTTGISGCGGKEYIKEFCEFASARGKTVKLYNIGEMMFEHASSAGIPITQKNVLNTNPNVLNSLRGAALEKVLSSFNTNGKDSDLTIIFMHASFLWKKIFIRAYEKYYIDKINPDIVITFIDDSMSIKQKLDGREQWDDEQLTEDEILLWENVEVEMSASFAEFEKKPFYVIPVKHPSDLLYKLIFHPRMEPVYVSIPMTHSSPESSKKIDDFIKKLNRYFSVFDPRTIEINVDATVKDKTIYYQTINRDLYWLIKQSKKVIGYFPEIVASSGVINELREGYETNKDVWLIFPSKKRSPFTDYFTTKLFENENEFFDFIRKYLKEKYAVEI